MGVIELILTGVGLSMDAFAVAVCKGLGMRRVNWGHALIIALFFGGFQALMPLIGWAAGSLFSSYITAVDHWIAFGLLALIGGKMLWDAFHEDNATCVCGRDCDHCSKRNTPACDGPDVAVSLGASASAASASAATSPATTAAASASAVPAATALAGPLEPLDYRELIMLAVATSIDALAVGITFAFLGVNIWLAIAAIGVTTFILSFAGVAVGNQFGARFEKPATIAGGIVLILLGTKILVEHLFG